MAKPVVKKKPVVKAPVKKPIVKKVLPPKKPPAPQPVANERAVTGGNSGVDGKRLKSFIDKIERLEEEKSGTADDIKHIYTEAKAVGFVPKIIKKIVAANRRDKEKLREEKELTELYAFALDPELADVLS